MPHGIKCEHGDSDRMKCGKCRICARISYEKTRAKRGRDTECARGHVGQWNATGRCKICAQMTYWRRKSFPDKVEKQRIRSLHYSRNERGLSGQPSHPPTEKCECCNKEFGKRGPQLDHCHSTGYFRGWLCSECNMGIGKLGDTLNAIANAYDYLGRHSKQSAGEEKCALQRQ
jgi:recombination endonuclease VII